MRAFRWSLLTIAALLGTATVAQEPLVYTLDAAGSDIHWRVYKAGTFARFGHNHVISVGELSGAVTYDADSSQSTFEIAIPVAGLVIDDPVLRGRYGENFSSKPSDEDIAGTRTNMLGERVLDAANYPMLRVHGRIASGAPEAATLAVTVDLLGRSVSLMVPCSIVVEGDELVASGEFGLTHADLGMTPFSVMLGALAVGERLDFSYQVRATRVTAAVDVAAPASP
jgi:hypothetical protein